MRQLGSVSLDGTKVKANASKHRAMSYKHARKIREQLRDEVDELLRMAEETDRKEIGHCKRANAPEVRLHPSERLK